jgi:hypothetical protein
MAFESSEEGDAREMKPGDKAQLRISLARAKPRSLKARRGGMQEKWSLGTKPLEQQAYGDRPRGIRMLGKGQLCEAARVSTRGWNETEGINPGLERDWGKIYGVSPRRCWSQSWPIPVCCQAHGGQFRWWFNSSCIKHMGVSAQRGQSNGFWKHGRPGQRGSQTPWSSKRSGLGPREQVWWDEPTKERRNPHSANPWVRFAPWGSPGGFLGVSWKKQ